MSNNTVNTPDLDARESSSSSADSSDDASSDDSSSSVDSSDSSSDDGSSSADSSDAGSSDDASSNDSSSSADSSGDSSSDSSSDDVSSDDSGSDDSSSSADGSDVSSDSSNSDDVSSSADSSGGSSDAGGDATDNSVAAARTSSDLDHSNSLVLPVLRIRLLDPLSAPMAGAAYRLKAADQEWTDLADGDGWVEKMLQNMPDACTIEWAKPPAADPSDPTGQEAPPPTEYLYQSSLCLHWTSGDDDSQATSRLANLGHSVGDALSDKIMAFQTYYGRPEGPTGKLEDVQADLNAWHDEATPQSISLENSWNMMGYRLSS